MSGNGLVAQIGEHLGGARVPLQHVVVDVPGPAPNPVVGALGSLGPGHEGRAEVVDALRLHVRIVLGEQDGAVDPHPPEVIAERLRLAAALAADVADDEGIATRIAAETLPRAQHREEAGVDVEDEPAAGLRARDRDVPSTKSMSRQRSP
ncbi:MAG TPA: hypothetical protein VK550_32365 [Polyangiaceae bacterium]|nr:hypothetical protein [Polyangiaceae bacterium]